MSERDLEYTTPERLVQDFAGRVDAEVWNRTFVTLKRILEVARSKKELLINNPGLALREIDQKQLDELNAFYCCVGPRLIAGAIDGSR